MSKLPNSTTTKDSSQQRQFTPVELTGMKSPYSSTTTIDCMLKLPEFSDILLGGPSSLYSSVRQMKGSLELLGCYAEVMAPTFIVVNDLVFRKETYFESRYSAFKHLPDNEIEKQMNRQLIHYLFPEWPSADKELLNQCARSVAEKIQECWRSLLLNKFPDRQFFVELEEEYDFAGEIHSFVVSFSQISGTS